MSGRIGLTVADGVARILIDRPDKMNAILPEMVLELQRVCQAVNDDANVRVATIMGAGERAFSAGSDLNTVDYIQWRIVSIDGRRSADVNLNTTARSTRCLCNLNTWRSALKALVYAVDRHFPYVVCLHCGNGPCDVTFLNRGISNNYYFAQLFGFFNENDVEFLLTTIGDLSGLIPDK